MGDQPGGQVLRVPQPEENSEDESEEESSGQFLKISAGRKCRLNNSKIIYIDLKPF